MKITKSKLKQIIKEELERALSEDDVGAPIYPQDPLAMAQAAAADPGMTAAWLSATGHPDWGVDDMTIHEMLIELGPDGVVDAFDYFAHPKINLPADGLIKEDPVVLEAFSYFWAWTEKNEVRLQRDIEAGGEELEELLNEKDEEEKKTKVSKVGQKRVSKKIGHLIGDEGKSKKQAAAIAYSMEKRGELK